LGPWPSPLLHGLRAGPARRTRRHLSHLPTQRRLLAHTTSGPARLLLWPQPHPASSANGAAHHSLASPTCCCGHNPHPACLPAAVATTPIPHVCLLLWPQPHPASRADGAAHHPLASPTCCCCHNPHPACLPTVVATTPILHVASTVPRCYG
jgi:hypothetical protein